MRHSSSDDETCFLIDVTNDVIFEYAQEILEEDPLDTFLEQAEETAQGMEMMVVFENEPLLKPPMQKKKTKSQQHYSVITTFAQGSILSNFDQNQFLYLYLFNS